MWVHLERTNTTISCSRSYLVADLPQTTNGAMMDIWNPKDHPDEVEPNWSDPAGFVAGLNDERHMAHYRFAFEFLPAGLFGAAGATIIRHFLDGLGRIALGALWFRLNPDRDIEYEAFTVDRREFGNGSVHFVVNMPGVSPGKLEAHYFGIYVPEHVVQIMAAGGTDVGGVRLLFLEESGFGLTMIGESSGSGVHTNLGYGPLPGLEAMRDVMEQVFEEGEPH